MKKSKGYKKRVERYPTRCIWKSQALTMQHWNLRIRISELEKISKKVFPKWRSFWNLVTDYDPKYCFFCGYYIPVEDRDVYAEAPFKNGDLVHVSCFKRLMQIKYINDRVNPNSELICHLDLGWTIQSKPICRERIKNNPGDIRKHLIEKHGWKKIPETVKNMEKKRVLEDYKINPIIWFNDNQLIFKNFRNIHFLKPNGKAFPKPRD